MSMNPDPLKNPLIRDGVSQRQRQSAASALSPDFVKLDEWELADALVYAYQLSQKVKYYGQDGTEAGNWKAFFTRSTPVQIALISKTSPQTVKETYTQALQDFLSASAKDKPLKLNRILTVWKGKLLKTIAGWHRSLEPYTPLKTVIQGLVRTNLAEPLARMQAFEQITGKPNQGFYSKLIAQFKLDQSAQSSFRWQLSNVDDRAELDAVFQGLFQTYRQIIQEAPQYLKSSLSDRQDHPPHLTLFFAFWEVMKPARDDLNRMTQRHLDFFYRQVLALPDLPAVPDRAHVLFELAKLPNLNEFKLASGTRFIGGKDAIGKDLIYKLDQEIVVHKAKIASLKGLFFNSKHQALYASEIANSFDGQGGAFPKEQEIQEWLPFGDESRQPVSLGIAIAADVLLLNEGNRTITLTLNLRNTQPNSFSPALQDLNPADLQRCFQIKVSGKDKDWTDAQLSAVEYAAPTLFSNVTDQLKLTIQLVATDSPLLPYRPELPGAVLPTAKPVLLLLLNAKERIGQYTPYYFLQSFQLIDLQLETAVDQVRNLILQNDLAILDANKPFQPFGTQPKAGNSLYIGSQEVFQKQLTTLKLDFKLAQPQPKNWLDIYAAYDAAENKDNLNQVSDNFKPGELTIQALRERTWSGTASDNLFEDAEIDLTDKLNDLHLDLAIVPHEITPLTNQTQDSFLRLSLTEGTARSDFLHQDYPIVLARQMVAVATNSPGAIAGKRKAVVGAYYRDPKQTIEKATSTEIDSDREPIIPKEPYLPVIQSLSIAYRAIAQKQNCTLFHLCPFNGFMKLQSEAPYLLPQVADAEGELLIGLQDLDPPTALPLLFQVVEESADTTLKKADVEWFYLQDNTWQSLRDRIVSDTTNGLIASGIVQLGIPSSISKAQTTILDPTLYWIKASVSARSPAVCHLINMHPQAAQVSFLDQENDPNHLALALPPSAIVKLEVPQPEIKAVAQPYLSFGGKVKESPSHFYLRVSEHLRHKGRAVTIFDYERLVLEKFPEIYKVRCINHGRWDETQDQMHEVVPGAVTLAVIPDLSKRTSLSDLEPKVNINLLAQVQDYLSSVSSAWADIRVVNPCYEKIRISCQVKLKSPYAANFGYYSRTLNQAITDFLAPWTRTADADIQFGGRLYYSAVLDLIEQQDYVDYVVDFKMSTEKQTNVREAIASTPRSVLTSGVSTPTTPYHKIQEFQDTMILPSQRLPVPQLLGYQALEDLTIE